MTLKVNDNSVREAVKIDFFSNWTTKRRREVKAEPLFIPFSNDNDTYFTLTILRSYKIMLTVKKVVYF